MRSDSSHQVLIVGAGPVGLFLGCCLQHMGIDFTIVERDVQPAQHSRSIGIHPPSLESFARLGLADEFIDKGVRVQAGRVEQNGSSLGSLSFDSCPGPYRFVLTVPQPVTESILENHLRLAHPGSILRGVEVLSLERSNDAINVRGKRHSGEAIDLSCSILAGCDGKDSLVRSKIGATFDGGPYDDSFVMGDFHDESDFGDEARIYLDSTGFVESFPLPGRLRRWVLRTASRVPEVNEADFRGWVAQRTGVQIKGPCAGALASFGVQRFVANRFHAGPVVLAGDAAHVVSPIGGQGMNVGWLNAYDLAQAIQRIVHSGGAIEQEFGGYENIARRRAWRAIRRAEFNMWIGRSISSQRIRRNLIRCLLHTPAKWLLARMFTMRWL